MTYRDTAERLAAWRGQIAELRQKMRDAQASVEPEPVHDYEFAGSEGSKRLSQLFGETRPVCDPQHGPILPELHTLGGRLQRYLPAYRRSRGFRHSQP